MGELRADSSPDPSDTFACEGMQKFRRFFYVYRLPDLHVSLVSQTTSGKLGDLQLPEAKYVLGSNL
jgi:hypothetical protein